MFRSLILMLLILSGTGYAVELDANTEKKVIDYIDKLVAYGLSEKKLKANNAVTDEVFLKRVYLDIVGRIPTIIEYEKFINSPDSDKRNKLIDQLHSSPGYVSHSFNYWADALRATSKMNKSTGYNYLQFIKKSISENKPYDQFVHEMVSAEGNMYKEGNGAVGYYVRDHQMPLDNLANTMQLFLATSMVCAQCHDHPYKKWSQMDFYQLAAFTNGTQTNVKGVDKKTSSMVLKNFKKPTEGKNASLNQSFKPLRVLYQGVYNSGTGKIQLPTDYDYDDAKPNQVVKAAVPYGPQVNINYDSANGAKKRIYEFKFDKGGIPKNVNSRKYFADWITSTENPMFTKTIVNRLWKRVMGVELVGDLIDMKESELGPNPKLTQFMISLMKKLKYDQKEFMKLIYKTKTYQRVATKEIKGKYYFQGPVVKRMSAEQIWDSLISLNDNNPDANSLPPKLISDNIVYREVSKMNPKQMADYLKNPKSIKSKTKVRGVKKPTRGKVSRASELRSPSDIGSMLRTYGQSSRQIIDDSSTEANIPQALTMMNDKSIAFSNTLVSKKLKSEKNINKQIEMIYKAVLCRKPTSAEIEIMNRYTAQGLKLEDIYWTLINSHEFKLRM